MPPSTNIIPYCIAPFSSPLLGPYVTHMLGPARSACWHSQ
ncbi:hypothetical protein AG1IA_04668 [Rhizoctonia solani AG-1 IA]|uniref:Uncharacterized protein n=1 Tax=Thanatephorus cucumeris (strain AG1-IA) TaxID=983506 RepID=L8WX18_THACA|nr:hypothetical protein AG1IA_04668 [Rhizoctonia solani AG-1 IA]